MSESMEDLCMDLGGEQRLVAFLFILNEVKLKDSFKKMRQLGCT